MTLDPKHTRVVDHQTTEFLRRNPSFARLSAAQQAETIRAMSTIVQTMAETARGGAAGDPYSPHAMGLAAPGIAGDPGGIQTVDGGAADMMKRAGGGKVGDVIGAG
ncbi:MAG TPA: hypothetical protein VFK02_04360, partial [Kofleriaceae bacterium]|nr:hypothetical protein [Kofleriaceae bacterium]